MWIVLLVISLTLELDLDQKKVGEFIGAGSEWVPSQDGERPGHGWPERGPGSYKLPDLFLTEKHPERHF